MPELPEVETTCNGVRPHAEGRVLSALVVRNPRLRQPVPEDLPARIVGARLQGVSRRAKYLLFDFGAGAVIVHLGMSGSLRVVPAAQPPGRHDHVDFVFGELALRLRDPRRFGMVVWQPGDADAHPLLAHLGPEPLGDEFDAAWLHRVTRGLRAPIKHVLMDSRRLVGVGNIYASESLFRARIHPMTAAGRLGPQRCAPSSRRCAKPCARRSPPVAARCDLSAATASRAISSSRFRLWPATASLAASAAVRSAASSAASARRISVRTASGVAEASSRGGGRERSSTRGAAGAARAAWRRQARTWLC